MLKFLNIASNQLRVIVIANDALLIHVLNLDREKWKPFFIARNTVNKLLSCDSCAFINQSDVMIYNEANFI